MSYTEKYQEKINKIGQNTVRNMEEVDRCYSVLRKKKAKNSACNRSRRKLLELWVQIYMYIWHNQMYYILWVEMTNEYQSQKYSTNIKKNIKGKENIKKITTEVIERAHVLLILRREEPLSIAPVESGKWNLQSADARRSCCYGRTHWRNKTWGRCRH